MEVIFKFSEKLKSKPIFILTLIGFLSFLIYGIYYIAINQFGIGLEYNLTYVIVLTIFSLSFLFLGLMQMSFKNWKDTFISLFTPLHFSFPCLIYLYIYLISGNNILSLLLGIGLPNFWEIIEIWIKNIGTIKKSELLVNFAKESVINKLLDIFIGLLGSILGFYLLGF